MKKLFDLFFGFLSPATRSSFLKTSTLYYFNILFGFFNSLLTVRLFEVELFGVIQFYLAISELPTILVSEFNRIINRFGALESRENREKLFVSAMTSQLLGNMLLLVFGFLLFLSPMLSQKAIGTSADSAPQTFWLFIFYLFTNLSMTLFNGVNVYLLALKKLVLSQLNQTLLIFLNSLVLISLLLSEVDKFNAVYAVLTFRNIVMLVLFVCLFRHIRLAGELKLQTLSLSFIKESFLFTYHTYFKSYAIHFQVHSVFGFLKDKVAVLILGSLSNFEGAAYYQILRSLYAIPRKFVPVMFQTFTSTLVSLHEKAPEAFKGKFLKSNFLQLGANVVIAFVCLFFTSFILIIYDLPNSDQIYWIAFFQAVNLIYSAHANTMNFVLDLEKDSKGLMYAAILRSTFVTIASFFLIARYGAVGAASAIALSCLLLVIFLSLRGRKSSLWKPQYNLYLLFVSIPIAGLLYLSVPLSQSLYDIILPITKHMLSFLL